MAGNTKYFQCPYCILNVRTNNKGKFILKTAGNNILIIKCIKCSGVFRVDYSPQILLWSHMTTLEKRCFTVKAWTKRKMAQESAKEKQK